MVTEQAKKLAKKSREDFELHVRLIMRQDQITKAEAQGRAYAEGVKGLDSRAMPAQPK